MSRFTKWTRALNGISAYLKSVGVEVNLNNYKKEIAIINEYSKHKKLNGSRTERILLISNNFTEFKNYILNK